MPVSSSLLMSNNMSASSFPYSLLKMNLLDKNQPYETLFEIKELFEKEINSRRLYSRIMCFKELFDTLEQRGAISEDNPKLLERIIPYLGEDEWKEVEIYRPPNNKYRWNDESIYAMERIVPFSGTGNEMHRAKVALAKFEPAKRDAIFKLIASDIGRKWRELGRSLGIKEGQMDELDARFPNNFELKVVKMLTLFEESNFNDRLYVGYVCQALVQCRRADLKRRIIDITTH